MRRTIPFGKKNCSYCTGKKFLRHLAILNMKQNGNVSKGDVCIACRKEMWALSVAKEILQDQTSEGREALQSRLDKEYDEKAHLYDEERERWGV